MTDKKFKQLVSEHEKLVFTVCYQLVRDYQEAENLTQETFLSAYFHIDRCSPDKYKPYLARIAANKAKDFLKSAYVRRTVIAPPEDAYSPSASPSPEELQLQQEGEAAIRTAILNLKEPYKTVSILFFLEEQSAAQIALQLDRPLKTVQTQISRAKKLLQKVLKEARDR